MVSPHNMVCVTTLPCKILITTLFFRNFIIIIIHVHVQSNSQLITLVVIIVNFCRNFMKIILKESYLVNNTYLYVAGSLVVIWRLLLWQHMTQ